MISPAAGSARPAEFPILAEGGSGAFVTQETIGSSLWRLETRQASAALHMVPEFAGLVMRSGGRNLFFEEAFQQAASGRFGDAAPSWMVLLEHLGEEAALKLAFPFLEERVGFPPVNAIRAFSHPFAPLSMPLIDMGDVGETISRFAALLHKLGLSKPLVLEDFPIADPVGVQLVDTLQMAGLATRLARVGQRAVLRPGPPGNMPAWLTRKRRHEFERLLRRLEGLGTVEFEKAERFWDVLVRFEEFLLLETRSWKGRKGSSIHIIRKTAAFARQAVGALAQQNRAVIYSLRLDGRAIASLIMLRSGNRFYPWKTAFDENYRAYSPGTQLILRATRQLLATPKFEFADSLARGDTWIDRLWPEKQPMATLVVSPDSAQALHTAAAIERFESTRSLARFLLRRRAASDLPALPAAPSPGKAGG